MAQNVVEPGGLVRVLLAGGNWLRTWEAGYIRTRGCEEGSLSHASGMELRFGDVWGQRLVDSATAAQRLALGELFDRRAQGATDAERLAWAVLSGDKDAALLLADLVQEQYVRGAP